MLVHVPVDDLYIENGPFKNKWLIAERWMQEHLRGFNLEFTLSSLASNQWFTRTIKVMKFDIYGPEIYFTGVFAGQLIDGWFNLSTRKGSIHPLDNDE